MQDEANIVKQYEEANVSGRIEILIKYYPNFIRLVEGYEQSLSFIIKEEKAYKAPSGQGRTRSKSLEEMNHVIQKVGDLTSYTKLKYSLLLINKIRCIIFLNIRKIYINAEVWEMLYTYEDAVTKFGSKYLLKKAVGEGDFFQQEKGVYSDTKYVPALQIISMKYPKAVFAMDSAFYYHGLTDVIPEKYCIATDRDAAKICKKNIIQIFENKNLLNLGVEQMEREGCVINIYSKERMLVELLRHKSKLPFDYYKEILLNYRDMIHDLDIPLIQDYAYEVPKTSMIMELLQLEVL